MSLSECSPSRRGTSRSTRSTLCISAFLRDTRPSRVHPLSAPRWSKTATVDALVSCPVSVSNWPGPWSVSACAYMTTLNTVVLSRPPRLLAYSVAIDIHSVAHLWPSYDERAGEEGPRPSGTRPSPFRRAHLLRHVESRQTASLLGESWYWYECSSP